MNSKKKFSLAILGLALLSISLIDLNIFEITLSPTTSDKESRQRLSSANKRKTTSETTHPSTQRVETSPCTGRGGRETRALFDYRQGIDLSIYNVVLGRFSAPIQGNGDSAQQKNSAQMAAWNNAFDKIEHLGLRYSLARQPYRDGYRQLRQDNNTSILKQDIKVYQEKETYDWDSCEHIYEVELAVPTIASFGNIPNALKELINSLNIQNRNNGSLEIEIEQLTHLIFIDPRFRDLVREMLTDPVFKEDLKYRDDETQRLIQELGGGNIEITNYSPGQFRINAFISSLIQQSVAPTVKELLRKYDHVQVTCWGYTDQLRVRRILYFGNAELGRINEVVSYLPGNYRDIREREIKNNIELSIARGFEGIHGLSILLGRQADNPRLVMQYAGGGEISTIETNRPESRKIKYVISFEDRRH